MCTAYTSTCTMPTYAERYKFAEVEKDGAKFLRDTLGLCNVADAASALKGNVSKLGTKDVVVQYLLNALQLIERQHMFVINQRGQLHSHLCDLNRTKSDLIRVQQQLIEQKPSYVQFKKHVIDEISSSVEDTVKTDDDENLKLYGYNEHFNIHNIPHQYNLNKNHFVKTT